MHFKIIILVLNFSNICIIYAKNIDRPLIKTSSGFLLGYQDISLEHQQYYGFKGIPYAEPPVGDLRFRAPVPHRGWTGIRDASEHGNVCTSRGSVGFLIGDEDCLFLNIYTPDLNGRFPVIFWIHGGYFSIGDGNIEYFGPDYFMLENIVVVTLNYRLNIFGFLSTGDKYAPGNAGLKDIVLALRWVNENIENFGGNSDNIVLSGQSAGAIAVGFLITSTVTHGLFSKAISASGTPFVRVTFTTQQRSKAFEAGEKLGIHTNDSKELIEKLRKVNFEDLVKLNPILTELEAPRAFRILPFVPVVEPEESDEEILIREDPKLLIENGNFTHVPQLIGITNAEGILFYNENMLDPDIFEKLNNNPYTMLPDDWNITRPSKIATEIVNKFKKFYLDGKELSTKNRLEWTRFLTDYIITYPFYEMITWIKKHQSIPIYSYIFSYEGELNYNKKLFQLQEIPGTCHGDDVPYLFVYSEDVENSNKLSENTILTRKRYVRMYANFAKTGNPTPKLDDIINIKWPQVGNFMEYLDIGINLQPHIYPFLDRMTLWHSLKTTYANLK